MSKVDRVAFHNPKNLGCFDLRYTQKNKVLPFKSVAGVYTSLGKVEIYNGSRLLKTYEYADMSLTGTNTQGSEKTLSLTLQGADFAEYRGKNLTAECTSFFIDGDLEMTFDLEIK